MSDHNNILDWLQDKARGWAHMPPATKIDTHHHYVPSFYAKGECSLLSVILHTKYIQVGTRTKYKFCF